jgi:hypothetical protein
MIQSQAQSVSNNRHRGVALVYALVMMSALVGFCSLAVDFGRIQVVDIQLQRAADGAAMAGAQKLPGGNSAVNSAAITVATENDVDINNAKIDPKQVTVQLISWTSPTNYHVVSSASLANAVSVSITNTTPLTFASFFGVHNHISTRATIAQRIVDSSTNYVSTHSNPWLAGEPDETEGSVPDSGWKGQNVVHEHPWQYDIAGPANSEDSEGEPYESPVQVGITIHPGSTITVSSVSGQGNNDFTQSTQYDATGNANGYSANYDDEASDGVAEHGIADATMPLNALNAVFLGKNVPDSQTPPSTLDFSTQAERDYAAGTNNKQSTTNGQFLPKVQQVFYVGNGMTSTGVQETVVAPQGATRLFLGTMDGHEWSNNIGGFTATITQTHVAIVN